MKTISFINLNLKDYRTSSNFEPSIIFLTINFCSFETLIESKKNNSKFYIIIWYIVYMMNFFIDILLYEAVLDVWTFSYSIQCIINSIIVIYMFEVIYILIYFVSWYNIYILKHYMMYITTSYIIRYKVLIYYTY